MPRIQLSECALRQIKLQLRRQSPSSASKSFWNQNLAWWVPSLRNVRWHPWSLWQDDTAPSPDVPHRESSSSCFPRFLQCYMQSSSLEVETREKSNLVRKRLHVTKVSGPLFSCLSANHKSHMLKLSSIPSAGYFPKALGQSLKSILCSVNGNPTYPLCSVFALEKTRPKHI